MQFRTVCSGLAFNIMSSMKSTSRLSRSILPMESENLSWSSSTSYSRAHISLELFSITNLTLPPSQSLCEEMRPQTHLMALLTILPKFDLSSAMGISSGFISVLIAFNDLYLMLKVQIYRSHLNQSFDFFRDVEVKPRRIFSSKGSLGDILTVTIYWNQFPEANFWARHQIEIKGYHLISPWIWR